LKIQLAGNDEQCPEQENLIIQKKKTAIKAKSTVWRFV
jgi:hypothetical protein